MSDRPPPPDAIRVVPNVPRLSHDDVADEYAVHFDDALPGGCMVWARYDERWVCNPWSTRALTRTLLARHAAEVERRHEALRAEGDRVVTAVYDALIRFAAEAGHDVRSELDDEMSPELPEFTCPSSDPADYARGLARGVVDALVEKVSAKVRTEVEAEWEAEISAEVVRVRVLTEALDAAEMTLATMHDAAADPDPDVLDALLRVRAALTPGGSDAR